MIRRFKITLSLMPAVMGTMLALWLMAIGLSAQVLRHELDERFDSALQETANRLLAVVVDDLDLISALGNQHVSYSGSPEENLVYQVRRPNGEIILRSEGAPDVPFSAPLSGGFQDTKAFRIYTKASSDDKLFVQVADNFGDRRNAVGESAMAMAIPLFAFVVVGGLAVWMIVNRVLSPIEELGQAIDDKNEANLAPVDLRRIPNELMPVVRSVNFLLERLRKAFDDEREFTAHSAHELRTPIAGALAQIQCLGNDLPEGAWKQRAATVENSLRMLGRFVERLLQLAKANSQVTMKSGIIDVGPVLDMLVADFQRDRLTGQRLQYNRAVTAPLVHNLDVDGFWIVMRNLIENAIAYGEPNTPVIVSVATDGSIRIANECAVMSNVTLETVRNRFVRGNNNVPGSGLGLAIADQMLKQMGGTLHLYSPALGRDTGFEAVIAFQSVEPGEEKAVCAPGTIG